MHKVDATGWGNRVVMWNLVGHGAKWAMRGAYEFSKTQAGQRLTELTKKAYSSTRDLTKDAVQRYQESARQSPSAARQGRTTCLFREGDVVVLPTGEVAFVMRYVERHEIGGAPGDQAPSNLLVVGLMQTIGEDDSFVVIAQSSVRKLADGPI